MADATSTRGGSLTGRIPTLDPSGLNYIAWKTIMPVIIRTEKYAWEVTSGKLKKPEQKYTDAKPPVPIPFTPEEEEQLKKFDQGNNAACAIILGSLHQQTIVARFYSETETMDALQIWERIQTNFNLKTVQSKAVVVNEFMRYRFNPQVSITENCDKFLELLYRVREVGVSADTQIEQSRLLDALPADWEPFRMSWGAQSGTTRLSTLLQSVRAEGVRRERLKIMRREESTALFTNSIRNSEGWKNQGGRNIICHRCGRPGHKRADCRQAAGRTHRGSETHQEEHRSTSGEVHRMDF